MKENSKLKLAALVLFGIFAFFFFLLLKLPDARIQNLAIAHMKTISQNLGILFSAEKVRISLVLGPAIKFYNVELKAMDDDTQALKIEFLKIKPRFFSMLTSTKKAAFTAELLGGEISGVIGAATSDSANGALVAHLYFDSVNLSQATLLKKFIPVQFGSGQLDGKIKLNLDFTQTQKSYGDANITVKDLSLLSQKIYGFNVPKISMSQAQIEFTVSDGGLLIDKIEIGKDQKTDDIVAKITGEGQIGQSLEKSKINLKIIFGFSETLKQSFPLLDNILTPAKTGDGKYAYKLTGFLFAPDFIPGM